MSHYRVGADPELFLADKTGKKILSAIGKIGGTKENPIQVEKMHKGFCYQEDNVLVEYNIPPVCSPEQFIKHSPIPACEPLQKRGIGRLGNGGDR